MAINLFVLPLNSVGVDDIFAGEGSAVELREENEADRTQLQPGIDAQHRSEYLL